MTWFKKRQPRLPLLIWGALMIPDAVLLAVSSLQTRERFNLSGVLLFSQIEQANSGFC